MYSLADYLWMLADETRVAAYAEAIRKVVRPGDRVLDVGAGFGFFSVVAARAGASRVDAIDTNPAVLVGPRLAAANGCADRIVFHQLDAEQLGLPHKVDVIISDLRGPTPFARRSLATLVGVRNRLLRGGGAIVPLEDLVYVAPCRAPAAVRRDLHAAFGREGIDTAPVERVVRDTPYRCTIQLEDLIAPGRTWTRVDYATVQSTDAHGGAAWTLDTSDTIAGLAVWFTSALAAGVGLSSAPGSPTRVYNQVYLPLAEPVRVEPGDHLGVDMAVRHVLDDYIWAWTIHVEGATGAERKVLRQNSIADAVIDPALLHRHGGQV